MAMESKKEIYDIIPPKYIPKTVLVTKGTSLKEVMQLVTRAGIGFPIIAKPDIGLKAFAVEKVNDEVGLKAYLDKIADNFLVQEFVDYPKEVGVFYARKPGAEKGIITGIVSKEFLSVTGDGQHSIKELIKQTPRSHFQLKVLISRYGSTLERILAKDEKFILVPYGSHTRGAKFVDKSHLKNEQLLETIDTICKQIPDFYFGRLDILYTNFDALAVGKDFSVIEVNGAGSEPTHIYDPKHSLFFAWREITRHWRLMYEISAINYRKGHRYLSYRDGRAMMRANKELEEHLKLI